MKAGPLDELEPRRHLYVAMLPDDDGGITSRVLGLRLAPTEMKTRSGEDRVFLRWTTLDGQLVRTGKELAEAARQAEEAARAGGGARGLRPPRPSDVLGWSQALEVCPCTAPGGA